MKADAASPLAAAAEREGTTPDGAHGASPPRVGLVLEGGGAKGAYAFGVLTALHERGVHVDAVAGTSVGGLNAALWSAGALAEGAAFWHTLSASRVYPLRRPKWLSRVSAPLIAAMQLVVSYFQYSLPPDIDKALSRWMRGIQVVGCLAYVALATYLAIAPNKFMTIALFVGMPFTLTVLLNARRRRADFLKLSVTVALASVVLPALYVVAIATDPLLSSLPGWVQPILGYLGYVIFVLVILPVVVAVIVIPQVWLLDKFERVSFLSQLPLRDEVSRIFAQPRFRVPVFVTVARKMGLIDPDDYFVQKVGGHGSWSVHKPHVPERFVPEYIRVDGLPPDALHRALLATAALPFGIVPAVELDGNTYVDGGVADNCPIYPLISVCPCDHLIVVMLSPSCDSDAEAMVNQWRTSRRIIALSQFDSTAIREDTSRGDVQHERPFVVPMEDPPFEPRFTVIRPREALGGFLDGTLNFSSKYAEKLIVMGYEDGCAAAERLAATESRSDVNGLSPE